jgi:hypothetical protein
MNSYLHLSPTSIDYTIESERFTIFTALNMLIKNWIYLEDKNTDTDNKQSNYILSKRMHKSKSPDAKHLANVYRESRHRIRINKMQKQRPFI